MFDYRCLEVRTSGETTVVAIKQRDLAELDYQEQLREELMSLVESASPQHLIVSLKDVEMIGSNAIGTLIDTRKKVQDNGGQTSLCDLQSTVRMSFQVLNLDGTLFHIYDTESDALKTPG